MKKIVLIALCFVIGLSARVQAKYVAPEGIKSRSDKITSWQINELDEDGDGKLSLDEFKRKTENYGREERRNVLRAQKEGFYMSPEDQFKAMDKNKDGKISDEEMADFVKEQREEHGMYY